MLTESKKDFGILKSYINSLKRIDLKKTTTKIYIENILIF
jgi:hypothetical protein